MPLPPSSPCPGSYFDHKNDFDRFRKTSNNLDSEILLAAIVSLSVAVLLVIALHVYARCVMSRYARHRAMVRSLRLTTGSGVQSSDQSSTGLDPIVISSLPIFVYKQTEAKDDASSVDCAVCLSLLEDEEIARLLPNCRHTFHAECIDKWLTSRSTCPICRTEAEPRILPLPRDGPAGGAPPAVCTEGTSTGETQTPSSGKVSAGSNSQLGSFPRMLSRELSSRRNQSEVKEEGLEDIERQ